MKYAKRYMAKIGSAGILLTALAATACMDHGDDIPLIELGTVENSFTVNATAGHVDIQVYSNQPAVLSFLDDGASWADLSDTRLPLDGKFYIDYADTSPKAAEFMNIPLRNRKLSKTCPAESFGGN